MFHPLPIFVGLRYVRTRRQGFFVSFISWVSMLGVCVGVAALITIISVMNGFEGELRTRLVSLTAHATLQGPPRLMQDWAAAAARARSVPGTTGVAPFADVQAMIGRAGQLQPVLLHGLDPAIEGEVSDIDGHMVQGRLTDLVPGERRIVLGRVIAWQLGADVGDEITVMVPGRELISSGGRPRLQTFTVSGVFEVGLQEHDGGLALVALEDAAALGGGAAGLRLQFDDVMRAPAR
ncbi:MAG: ABC transporter permease, partial [Steroidobacteraceae bacterium]|nr:ABC transporter permease [Steroidobacteraceae bacterium]